MANIYMQFDQYDCIIIWECYSFSVVTDHMLSLHETYQQTVLRRCQLRNTYSKLLRICSVVKPVYIYPTKVHLFLSADACTL